MKTYILILISKIKRFFYNTSDIRIISDDNNTSSVFIRYFLIRLISYIINMLKYIINTLDVNISKIQITKDYSTGCKTMIFDNNNIFQVIDYIDNNSIGQNSIMGKHIIMQFELEYSQDKKVCLKKYLAIYSDHEKNHSHTLENIILFNKPDIGVDNTHEDMQINISCFKNGRITKTRYQYNEVKNKHIADFFETS